jgi:hypothetical protein
MGLEVGELVIVRGTELVYMCWWGVESGGMGLVDVQPADRVSCRKTGRGLSPFW